MVSTTDLTVIVHKARRMKASSARRAPEVEPVPGGSHPGLGVTIHTEGRLAVTLAALQRGGSGVYRVLV